MLLLPAGPGAREQPPPCLTCCSRNSLSLHGRGKGLDKFMGEKSIRKVLKKTIPASQIAGHKQESLCTHFAWARSLPSASPPAAGATGEPVDALLLGTRTLTADCWGSPTSVLPNQHVSIAHEWFFTPNPPKEDCRQTAASHHGMLTPAWCSGPQLAGEPELNVLNCELVTFFVSSDWMGEKKKKKKSY